LRRLTTNQGRRKRAAYVSGMRQEVSVGSLSDDELLRRVSELLGQSRRTLVDLIAHIGEVDARRLFAREATPSMFAWCTERLHLSEHEAFLRIAVARASRRYPVLLEMLRDGRLHLSGIARLAPHLTPDNLEAVLKRATHKSKREIEELIAELAPRPEAASVVRRVSEPGTKQSQAPAAQLVPERVAGGPAEIGVEAAPSCGGDSGAGAANAPARLLVPERVPDQVAPALRAGPVALVEPVAPARFRVHVTVSAELRDKLERLKALMRSSVPDGDLARLIDVAVSEKLERLEAKRYAKTARPRKSLAETDTRPTSRYIPAAVRRAVEQRDGGRCTYRDDRGRRCSERQHLEFHHRGPFGRGGDHSPSQVTLHCRAHNLLMAERDYGWEKMAQYRRSRDRVSEPLGWYATGGAAIGPPA